MSEQPQSKIEPKYKKVDGHIEASTVLIFLTVGALVFFGFGFFVGAYFG